MIGPPAVWSTGWSKGHIEGPGSAASQGFKFIHVFFEGAQPEPHSPTLGAAQIFFVLGRR